MGRGRCPLKRYNRQLRVLIIRGRPTLSIIVSHELPLQQASQAYDQFDKRVDGWTQGPTSPRGVGPEHSALRRTVPGVGNIHASRTAMRGSIT
ncbi:MAG: hypothetical protein JO296_03760 [Pseudonocardiales bacterium]|nr:hypothetical protein [Pseudonocardiales bacterium]